MVTLEFLKASIASTSVSPFKVFGANQVRILPESLA